MCGLMEKAFCERDDGECITLAPICVSPHHSPLPHLLKKITSLVVTRFGRVDALARSTTRRAETGVVAERFARRLNSPKDGLGRMKFWPRAARLIWKPMVRRPERARRAPSGKSAKSYASAIPDQEE